MTIWQTISNAAAAAVRSDAISPILRALGLDGSPKPAPVASIAFTIAIIALSAKMAKSDGVVTTDEVEAFRRVCTFADSEAATVRRVFDLAKQDIAGYETYARQIGDMLADEPELKRDVLEGLFVIAAADGILHEREDLYLRSVAGHLGITPTELAWVRALFVEGDSSPYDVLGLHPGADFATIRARHRALVLEHHPDRLTGRGVPREFIAIAERKLAAINAAYDAIERERGL